MKREMPQLRLPDPEILEAQKIATELLREFKASTDPLTKLAIKVMVYDALNYEAELRLKSRAKDMVENLHNLQNPNINPN